jgi:hypothetical protein
MIYDLRSAIGSNQAGGFGSGPRDQLVPQKSSIINHKS